MPVVCLGAPSGACISPMGTTQLVGLLSNGYYDVKHGCGNPNWESVVNISE